MTRQRATPNPQTLRDALRALPDAVPPDDVWHEVERRIGTPLHRRRSGVWIAAAAGVLVTVAAGIWLLERAPTGVSGGDISSLVAQSQQLERRVARYGVAEQDTWDSSRRALVYRIADLDRELAPLSIDPSRDPIRAEQLWRQRVALMQSLAELDRADAPHRTLAL